MACALALALVVAVLAPATAGAWAPAGQATSTRACRPSPPAPSAPRTSSTRTGRTSTSARPPTARAPGGQTETDGCTSGSLPIGTPVEVDGASKPGTLVYNSWLTMQATGEADPDTCAVQRPGAGQARPGRRRQRRTLGPRLRRPDRRRLGGAGHGDDRLHLRQLVAARRRHEAQPQAGRRRAERGQRLEPHRLHRHAGHPG